MIIKTDAIGDYILFRNFIEIVKRSDKYKGYEIDLLGNSLWKDIAIKYDSQFINGFFFIKPAGLYEMPVRTLKIGWRLFRNNYHTVLQPTYTRSFINDGLAALTAANNIVGFEGDNESIEPRYKVKTDKFYTRKLRLPPDISFEFKRSKFFFERILEERVTMVQPALKVATAQRNGIVIFTGAGAFKRRWELDKFLDLIKQVSQHTTQPVYLAGNIDEAYAGDYLIRHLAGKRIENLTGKTSLLQLIELISGAVLVIANDTSAVHIAAATKTKCVCILGGGHFERFAPYPDYFPDAPVCVYHKMPCYNCNWNCKFTTMQQEPYPCISNINYEYVWQAVLQLLPVKVDLGVNSN